MVTEIFKGGIAFDGLTVSDEMAEIECRESCLSVPPVGGVVGGRQV